MKQIISLGRVQSDRADHNSALALYLNNLFRFSGTKTIMNFTPSKDYTNIEQPNINWEMSEKLMPVKTNEQKGINTNCSEEEIKAFILKQANKTSKQTENG